MKRYLTLIFFTLIIHQTYFSQNWQWARIEPQTNGEGFSVCKDQNGNAFLCGTLLGTATVGNATYTTPGVKNIVVKYDPAGNILWSYGLQTNSGYVNAISSDNNGNAYLTGSFNGTFAIGTNTYGTVGGADIFILKLDNLGNLVWIRTVGNTLPDYSTSIATDGNGNSVIVGWFVSPSLNFGSYTTANPSMVGCFVVKYDTNGNVLWTNDFWGTNTVRPTAVALDASGNVQVAGYYNAQLTAGSTTLNSAGANDVFIAKYGATSGVLQYIISTGTIGTEIANAIEFDPQGDFYITGSLSGSLCGVGTDTYSTQNNQDAFLAKYNASGNFLWSRRVGSPGLEVGYSLAPHANGVFVAISVLSPSIQIGTQTYTFSVLNDGMALLQFDPTGNLNYATTLNGGGDDQMDICLDNACGLYLGGDLYGPSVTIGNTTLTHTTTEAIFIAKLQVNVSGPNIGMTGNYTLCAGSSTTLQASGASSYTWSTGAISSSLVVSPATNTVYMVTGSIGQSSCSGSSTQSITVNAIPMLTVSGAAKPFCQGQMAILMVSGANSFTWSNGINSNTISVAVTSNTVYSVVGQSTLTNCQNTSSVQLQVNSCLGIETDHLEEVTWSFYPNPASDHVLINSDQSSTIILTNLLGETLGRLDLDSTKQLKLNLTDLGPGIYFLKMENSESGRKLVIQH